MRPRLLILVSAFVACGAVACEPEISGNTYYCGPERLCPPDLVCNDSEHVCNLEALYEPFACPAGSEQFEADDTLENARDLGNTTCAQPLLSQWHGCIDNAADVDLYAFTHETTCSGDDPHMELTLRFPIAFAPLRLEILDASGEVVATAEDCTSSADLTGTYARCVRLEPSQAAYFVRVSAPPGVPSCDGACAFNEYVLDILFPVS